MSFKNINFRKLETFKISHEAEFYKTQNLSKPHQVQFSSLFLGSVQTFSGLFTLISYLNITNFVVFRKIMNNCQV